MVARVIFSNKKPDGRVAKKRFKLGYIYIPTYNKVEVNLYYDPQTSCLKDIQPQLTKPSNPLLIEHLLGARRHLPLNFRIESQRERGVYTCPCLAADST